jgi:WhiB family redox-sensing transcriptional regulator
MYEWMEHAACKGRDTNDFFDNYEKNPKLQIEIEKLCNSCPVQAQCYEYAMENGLVGGVFKKYIPVTSKKKISKRRVKQ